MVFKEIEKSKFAQVNNKGYYFSNRFVSLSFSHPFLKEIVDLKREEKQRL